jgi:hypothetical protein
MMPSVPPTPPQAPAAFTASQYDRDREHLRLLAIFWYVWGGLMALGVCGSLVYVGLGAMMLAAPPQSATTNPNDPSPEMIGGIFLAIGGLVFALTLVMGVLAILTGRSLATQRRRTLCYVMAALACLSIPLGTILGVFTFVVLGRPTVAEMFARNRGP